MSEQLSMFGGDGYMSLEEAKEWLRDRVNEGAHCPCCNQFAKVYPRAITSPMARGLIAHYRKVRREWGHAPTTAGHETHEFSQLAWWGLVEEMPEAVRADGGRAGWWRITEKGEQFVLNRLAVYKKALVYDGQRVDFDLSKGHATIRDALGTKFNYRELMGWE